ncbi:TerC family protein [Clostridium oryzae]|uniref:Integral membrane protein TerC family protein n=1 Tax=Clostridium oryzae TaxID=1450648 RepID=A0A1V4IHD2_9CLOT|nr:TerC family protein [Clostridium oryzae]OPJ59336.1 integral membrane protein TerC family protein [Clostridium oryzae]
MNNSLDFLLGVLEITLLDLTLCGDNIGVIALATRNLPKKFAKLASIIGISVAIILRIYFAACISVFLNIKWLPIKFFGGIILIKVTWDLIKPQKAKENKEIGDNEKFWDAVISVVVADISMSLDNVLAIAGAANGNFMLIVFGILLNIPIIFWGSQVVVNVMNKYGIVIYIGAAILAYTSIKMIIEDDFVGKYIHISNLAAGLLPKIFALITMVYGLYVIYCRKKQ